MSEPVTEAERLLLQWNLSGPPDVFLAELRAYRDEARADALDVLVEVLAEVLFRQRMTVTVGSPPRDRPDYLDRQTAALIAEEYRAILAERQP